MSTALTVVVVIAIAAVIILLLVMRFVAQSYIKVGPNEALIISGSHKEPKVITGGAAFVAPILNRAQILSLELMSFDVAPRQDLYTNQGVAVNVEAVTQLKVRSDRESVLTAAEQFLSKDDEDREALIRLVMEGHLRGIVGQLTVEQLVKEPEMVSEKMRNISSSDLSKMGLDVVSFTIKEVRDNNDYIANMGRPEIERIKKEANIAAAMAARDTQIQQSAAMRESAIAKSQADQARVEAESASQTKQAEFTRDLSLKKASYDAEVKKEQASADKAYDIQANVMQQQVVAESTRVQEIEKTAQAKVQEAEIKRREMELQATVLKTAEADRQRMEISAAAERQRVEIAAEAERKRLALEAEGRAEALRAQAAAEAEATRIKGLAEAEAARARGLAEAEVIRARGEAEAEAMRVKAEAYQQYNQAAVLDKLLTNMPEVVRALAEPLSKVDRVTIVSTGSDGKSGLGASRMTGDMVNMMAQVPAMFEMLSGVKLEDLLGRIPGLRHESNSADHGANDGEPTPEENTEPVAVTTSAAATATPSPSVGPIVDAAPANTPNASNSHTPRPNKTQR